ncbi:serine/threonine-protein kinase D3-like [Tropilaelaps mercedesae]|uniref:Serine/threonine-protein kinase D3-like n=1 Tax=Tropilaelaps mercedesae TaxID=418985 RepID=A0A1V9XV50_9ACAR|nr:serine/threonine-protein kinase D3-like [Tropilaelaps mercedesae]
MKTTDSILPLLNIPTVVNFQMQLGLQKDTVTIEIAELNLKSLKDLACNFVDRKVPEHGLNRLPERLVLLRHDYTSDNILLPINWIWRKTVPTLCWTPDGRSYPLGTTLRPAAKTFFHFADVFFIN